ncbi:MAG TPA: hypothetical protein VG273_26265 [Bryobacteraceae bacterium]|jgi:hypothetical protein|nr:hypothetical protein [Bryobacteraceae bacterium]
MLIARDGALVSLVGSIYVLVLMRFNPRLFLQHFYREIREVVPPKSKKERRISVILGLLMGVPFISGLLWRTATLGVHSFWQFFAYVFGVLFIFNLVDLIILDWLIVCWFKPRWVVLPGTEHIVVRNPYLHHFKGFLAGSAGLAIAGVAIAAVLSFQS